jgi:hypothetical protein
MVPRRSPPIPLKAARLPAIWSTSLLLCVLTELLSFTMDEKHVLPAEKGLDNHQAASATHADDGEWREQESFMTRNGLNLRSFGRRPVGDKHVPLDKSMQTRHLHMIAIGGSIGAGFFVGSGSALRNGVSLLISRAPGARSPPTGPWLASHRFHDHGSHDLQRR